MAAAISEHLATVRTLAPPEGRSQTGLEGLEPAARGMPTRPATRECVSGAVKPQGRQLDLAPPAAYALPAQLMPSCSLERGAQRRTGSGGEPLRTLAEPLRPPRGAPGGACAELSPLKPSQLTPQAQRRAEVFQRARAPVEGRHGSRSLRTHPRRGLAPRARACRTAVHHFFRPRADGTTAAARFVGQKPRSLLAALLESVEIPPPPLSPPRRAVA